ncbi:MAG: class I SAM-dependent methyltransferase [Anaerolineae bacterium]|nr:class I SAM-dependent methyltransferase [Anaerolineae bacterium]
MGRLAVRCILALNARFPTDPVHRELTRAKRTVLDCQVWECNEIGRTYEDFAPYWDLEGKLVLDVGCGLGGKTSFLAEQGAAGVVAVDLRAKSVRETLRLSSSRGLDVRGLVGDGALLPLASNSCDVVTAINTFEHVAEPGAMLDECWRVLRPGGLLLLHFPPFYSPWGPHLDGWIDFPWPHLFFSERDLVRAAAQVEAKRALNETFIPSAQVSWAAHDCLPDLNRITLREFWAMVRRSRLRLVQARLLPFGRHFLQSRPGGLFLVRLLYAMARVPLLNELVVTKIACVLRKEDEAP